MSSAEPHGQSKSDVNFQSCYATELGDLRTEPVKSPRKRFAKCMSSVLRSFSA